MTLHRFIQLHSVNNSLVSRQINYRHVYACVGLCIEPLDPYNQSQEDMSNLNQNCFKHSAYTAHTHTSTQTYTYYLAPVIYPKWVYMKRYFIALTWKLEMNIIKYSLHFKFMERLGVHRSLCQSILICRCLENMWNE